MKRQAIVVVEDEPYLRDLLVSALATEDFDVTSAGTYQEAIDVVSAGAALVVTDIDLPGPSGIDLLRAIHASWPDTKVVCISADPRRLAEASQAGANGVRIKPVSPQDLLHVVRSLISPQLAPQ